MTATFIPSLAEAHFKVHQLEAALNLPLSTEANADRYNYIEWANERVLELQAMSADGSPDPTEQSETPPPPAPIAPTIAPKPAEPKPAEQPAPVTPKPKAAIVPATSKSVEPGTIKLQGLALAIAANCKQPVTFPAPAPGPVGLQRAILANIRTAHGPQSAEQFNRAHQ